MRRSYICIAQLVCLLWLATAAAASTSLSPLLDTEWTGLAHSNGATVSSCATPIRVRFLARALDGRNGDAGLAIVVQTSPDAKSTTPPLAARVTEARRVPVRSGEARFDADESLTLSPLSSAELASLAKLMRRLHLTATPVQPVSLAAPICVLWRHRETDGATHLDQLDMALAIAPSEPNSTASCAHASFAMEQTEETTCTGTDSPSAAQLLQLDPVSTAQSLHTLLTLTKTGHIATAHTPHPDFVVPLLVVVLLCVLLCALVVMYRRSQSRLRSYDYSHVRGDGDGDVELGDHFDNGRGGVGSMGLEYDEDLSGEDEDGAVGISISNTMHTVAEVPTSEEEAAV